jgi:cytochrome c6
VKSNRNCVAALLLAAAIAIPAFAQSGANTYKSKCLRCHGKDGLGDTPAGKAVKAASYKDPAIVRAMDDFLFVKIKFGQDKMPAFKRKLTDPQIRAVIAYIRTLQ